MALPSSSSTGGSLTGYRPQPASQAFVVASGRPDKGSINSSRLSGKYTQSYFYHSKTAAELDVSFFEMKQNELVGIIKNPHADQTPLFRSSLNGVDFAPETKDIIYSIEENLRSFDVSTRNELVREILSRKIYPIGVVKGDGFTYKGNMDIAQKKHDRFVVDCAGTVSMRVRSENLGMGMLAEIKIPTRYEWMDSEIFDTGNIGFFADPYENRTLHDRLSEIFWKFNPFEHPDLAKLLKKTMSNPKKKADLPASFKLVKSVINLMKQISILSVQKAYSAEIIRPVDQFGMSNEICFRYPQKNPSDAGFILAKLRNQFPDIATTIDGNEAKFAEIYRSMRCESDVHSKVVYMETQVASKDKLKNTDKIFNPAYHPELYRKSPLMRPEFYAQSMFESSLNMLTFTFFLSDIINMDSVNLSGVRKKRSVDKFILGNSMSEEQKDTEKLVYSNNYNEMYHFLIHDFLPHVESSFYQLGNRETPDGQPEINTFLYEKVFSSDTSMPSNTDYYMNLDRDIGRSNQHIHECFSNFLSKIIRWAVNMNHGLKMRVTEPAGHLQRAALYVR